TGGSVYRGQQQPALTGAYIFADYCPGRFRALSRDAGGRWQLTELINANMAVSSFGADEQGELYVLGYDKGTLYRVVAAQKSRRCMQRLYFFCGGTVGRESTD